MTSGFTNVFTNVKINATTTSEKNFSSVESPNT